MSASAAGVVLIVLDSVRSDAIDLDPAGETPHIAALAARGTRFDRAIAPAAWTLPSHVTMFTGTSPTEHRIQAMPSAKEAMLRAREMVAGLATRGELLPAHLSETGVDTWLGSANVWVSPAAGFGSFDAVEYVAFPPTSGGDQQARPTASPRLPPKLRRTLPLPIKHAGRVLAERVSSARYARPLARWAMRRQDKGGAHLVRAFDSWAAGRTDRWFAMMCLIETHDPHLAPKGFGSADLRSIVGTVAGSGRTLARRMNQHNWGYKRMSDPSIRRLRRAYEGEVRYADHCVGEVVAALERRGHLHRTTVIVTADHGESFGENGLLGHGTSLGEQVLRVPLIVAGPDVPSEVVFEPVGLGALAATITEALGDESGPFPTPGLFSADGRGRARAELEAPGAYFHSSGFKFRRPPEGMDSPAAAFYEGQMKLVVGSFWKEAMFDLAADPDEKLNLVGSRPIPSGLTQMRAAWAERVGEAQPG